MSVTFGEVSPAAVDRVNVLAPLGAHAVLGVAVTSTYPVVPGGAHAVPGITTDATGCNRRRSRGTCHGTCSLEKNCSAGCDRVLSGGTCRGACGIVIGERYWVPSLDVLPEVSAGYQWVVVSGPVGDSGAGAGAGAGVGAGADGSGGDGAGAVCVWCPLCCLWCCRFCRCCPNHPKGS